MKTVLLFVLAAIVHAQEPSGSFFPSASPSGSESPSLAPSGSESPSLAPSGSSLPSLSPSEEEFFVSGLGFQQQGPIPCPAIPADGCSVCGVGLCVTLPEAVFAFPGQPTAPCGILEDAGEGGAIPLDQCPFLGPIIATLCGCASSLPAPPTAAPTTPAPATRTTAPVVPPTAAPVVPPTAAPIPVVTAAPVAPSPFTLSPFSPIPPPPGGDNAGDDDDDISSGMGMGMKMKGGMVEEKVEGMKKISEPILPEFRRLSRSVRGF